MEFGFIGVGAMGGPLARNLIRAGKTVHVYNRSAEGRDKTLAVGKSGVPAMSMADMAPCKVVFTCLALPEHLTEKALGTDGLYAHMQPGSVHVELSTIDSHTAFALAEAADRQGIAYIQCPLGKTPAHAERGEAPLFVGGDQQAIAGLAEVWPILGVFNNVGTVEAACAVKLVSNLVGMANLAVLSEGLRIGEAAGVEKNLLLQLLGETGAQSFQLDARGKSMAQGEYDPPRFALELALKDLRLGCGMAHGMNVDVPLLDMVFARFGRGEAAGLGKKDCAAVHEV
ncbi:NAD(P)-dependent oxidoreductase [Desulfovibrio sp. QI0430]